MLASRRNIASAGDQELQARMRREKWREERSDLEVRINQLRQQKHGDASTGGKPNRRQEGLDKLLREAGEGKSS